MGSSWHMYTSGRAESDEPEPQAYVRPDWVGPPPEELGRAVDLAVVLARAERGVVALSHAIVYSNGVSLHFVSRATGLTRSQTRRFFHEQHISDFDGEEDIPDGYLRLGIEFSDGARVSNLTNPHLRPHAYDQLPDGPVLTMNGGGSGQSGPDAAETRPTYWLWPLPPEGLMKVSCEWPLAGIPFTSTDLDVAPLREAAQRALKL